MIRAAVDGQGGEPAMTNQDRITDPGFTAAMDQTAAAVRELCGLGVPYERAMTIVQRTYSTGLDRGLYLGLRKAHVPTATS
jgi:hypothetical protein